MGPHGVAPYSEAGGSPDHAVRAQEFVKRHPVVRIYPTPDGWEATWLELAPVDAMTRRLSRPILGHLIDALEARLDGIPHEITPQPGTAYSAGPRRAGLPADLLRANHYPVEAICLECGMPVRLERLVAGGEDGEGEWQHTGRKPGAPG